MTARSLVPWLTDIVEAIARVRSALGDLTPEAFEADWQKQWLIERGLEIVSEASRHLSTELKARHPQIPWPKVAGIGNILRHDYGKIAAPIIWKLVRDDLPSLENVCRDELAAAVKSES
ncbi:MAG: DUF86 domain-containing protein [bacterium]|nr:DUF86 domain-containing protein [bacterium]